MIIANSNDNRLTRIVIEFVFKNLLYINYDDI